MGWWGRDFWWFCVYFNHNWQQQVGPLPCGVMEILQSIPGVMQTLVAAVQDQLRGVQHVQATPGAFAAILENGSVVTWGDADFGGDSSAPDSSQSSGLCRDSGRWICRYLGSCRPWR